jgi:hypothetical protein
MGIVLVVGMMLYSVGMCVLFDRLTRRSAGVRRIEVEDGPPVVVVVPDRVPAEWVDAYRAEQGG